MRTGKPLSVELGPGESLALEGGMRLRRTAAAMVGPGEDREASNIAFRMHLDPVWPSYDLLFVPLPIPISVTH